MTPGMSRRQFLLCGVVLPMVGAVDAMAQAVPAGDHGIGGSGLSARGGDSNEDHGIGGTGIVGTIQGFGSIIVNDVHIPFGLMTPISLDGRSISASRMKVGHVVRVLLVGDRARLIAVVSEVQGRIDRMDRRSMTVLSQRIDITEVKTKGLKKGGRVAVFGIRKPDGTIVARRIEHRTVADGAHVRGIPARKGGRLMIGGLVLSKDSKHLAGQQTIVRFRTNGPRSISAEAEAEPIVPGLTRGVVNVETYGRRGGANTFLGLGIFASRNGMRLSPDGHGFVNFAVRDWSRMAGFGDGRGPDSNGPPAPPDTSGQPTPDRSPFASDRRRGPFGGGGMSPDGRSPPSGFSPPGGFPSGAPPGPPPGPPPGGMPGSFPGSGTE